LGNIIQYPGQVKTLITILFVFLCSQISANKILVGKDKAIRTLKKGIEIARNGDTVLLHKGVYQEENIIIQKAIFLIGINDPVLDGGSKNEILLKEFI
jgi:nitrous oxidase accessory protein